MQELNSLEIRAKGKCSRGDRPQPYRNCHVFPHQARRSVHGCLEPEHKATLGTQEGRTGAKQVAVTSGI